MLNNWSGVGRLTKEPELRSVGENTVCNFTLAINRPYKDKDGEQQADFIQCQAWNKQAEFMNTYLHKGQLISVTGSIRTRTYVKEDKTTAYITEIDADSVESLERRDPQSESDIKAQWTKEWDSRVKGCKTESDKMKLKKELNDKYQPMIDALNQKVTKNDLPF